jgi:hypothetical protein
MSNNNGGSAFPVNQQDDRNGDTFIYAEPGMTLRDYFAAKAMQGFAGGGGYDKWEYLTQDAYAVADAMLKAREVWNE